MRLRNGLTLRHAAIIIVAAYVLTAVLAAPCLTLDKEVEAGRVKITGSKEKVDELLSTLVKFNPLFNIVTP